MFTTTIPLQVVNFYRRWQNYDFRPFHPTNFSLELYLINVKNGIKFSLGFIFHNLFSDLDLFGIFCFFLGVRVPFLANNSAVVWHDAGFHELAWDCQQNTIQRGRQTRGNCRCKSFNLFFLRIFVIEGIIYIEGPDWHKILRLCSPNFQVALLFHLHDQTWWIRIGFFYYVLFAQNLTNFYPFRSNKGC